MAGRPPKFTSPEEMDAMIDAYLLECIQKEEPLTITGLTLALGFCDKCSLYEYQEKPEFTHSVKRARLLVENAYEKRIEKGAGPIFALKNFGWSDKQDLNIGGQEGNPLVTKVIREIVRAENKDG